MMDDPKGTVAEVAAGERDDLPPLREARATLALAAAWVLVYLAMAWRQGTWHQGGDLLSGSIAVTTTHVFGDQTPAEIGRGQVWRAVTSSFVHFGPLHLVLNLVGFVLFGRIVEAWYGSGPFVLIYATIALAGNLLSGWIKLALGAGPLRPSGGGSGVAIGLIALIAFAGWRSASRFGDYVRFQMCLLLILMGIMGTFFRAHDNTGHATGALVGVLIGLAHPALVRTGPACRRLAGVLGIALLLACAGAQVRADRAESRFGRLLRAETDLRLIGESYGSIAVRGPRPRPALDPLTLAPTGPTLPRLRAVLQAALVDLAALDVLPRTGPVAQSGRLLQVQASQALRAAPTPNQVASCRRSLTTVLHHVASERTGLGRSLSPVSLARLPLLGRRGTRPPTDARDDFSGTP